MDDSPLIRMVYFCHTKSGPPGPPLDKKTLVLARRFWASARKNSAGILAGKLL